MSDRVIHFPDRVWAEVEALPQPLRRTAQARIFYLLDEPVPTLADPFPAGDPLPGAYRLHLPTDGLTIWYTVSAHEGRQVVMVQHVKADT